MSGLLRRRVMMAGGLDLPQFVTSIRESGARTGYIATGYTPPDDSSFCVVGGNEQTTTGFGGFIFMCIGSNGGSTYFAIGGASNATRRQGIVRYDTSANLAVKDNWLPRTYATYALFVTPKRYGVGNSVSGTYTKGSLYPSAELIMGKNPTQVSSGYDGMYRTFYVFGSDAQNETSYNAIVNNHTPIATFRPCIYRGVVTMWHVEQNRPCTVHDGTFQVYEA